MPAGAKGLNAGGRRLCTHCGADCRDIDRFCAACGQTLSPAPAAWGEVKPATILFADIVDSTRQIAELSPEQAMRQHLLAQREALRELARNPPSRIAP